MYIMILLPYAYPILHGRLMKNTPFRFYSSGHNLIAFSFHYSFAENGGAC